MIPTERRQRITDVFDLAVQVCPEERDAFVERECHGDSAVLKEVKSLLSEYQSSGENFGGACAPVEAEPSSLPVRRIGRYEITGKLGSGGFGQVYSALDPAVGRIVAVKVMNAPSDPEMVRRFRAEAMTVANLHHKNIVTVHEFGQEDGAPYLVMEYLDGTTLQELIRGNSLSLLEKLEIMIEVAEGLQYAHERGVTHRDVKPANIMRITDGSVKIMDFGIARMTTATSTRLTQAGLVIGSLTYMAPEQFNGISDALSDIFAYGTTFYELLTGNNPFSSPDPAVVMSRITNTDLPPVRSASPDCPEALDRIVRGTLVRDREGRCGSLSDVVVDASPILLDLRHAQAGRLYAEAEQLVAAKQLEAARSTIRKVLELDPVHAGARRLRSEIDEALHHGGVVVCLNAATDGASVGHARPAGTPANADSHPGFRWRTLRVVPIIVAALAFTGVVRLFFNTSVVTRERPLGFSETVVVFVLALLLASLMRWLIPLGSRMLRRYYKIRRGGAGTGG